MKNEEEEEEGEVVVVVVEPRDFFFQVLWCLLIWAIHLLSLFFIFIFY